MTKHVASPAFFLSASFPSGTRGEAFKPFDPGGLSDAVSACARAVLSGGGTLVFGGHPTITPLVLLIAREVAVRHRIVVYQSRWFADDTTPETNQLEQLELGTIRWTRAGNDLESSLKALREAMLRESDFLGGVFIGGMEGIFTEFEMFRERFAGRPALPIVAAGGAASRLVDRAAEDLPEDLVALLHTERYPALFFEFLKAARHGA